MNESATKTNLPAAQIDRNQRVITVRMSPELHEQIIQAASECGVSMNKWAISAIEKSIDHDLGVVAGKAV